MSANEKGAIEFKKILIVFLVLLILLGVAFFIRSRQQAKLVQLQNQQTVNTENLIQDEEAPTLPPLDGVYILTPSIDTVNVGESVKVDIYISAKNKVIDGADIIVKYDKDKLTGSYVTEGTIFSSYPRRSIDTQKGLIKITGFGNPDSTALVDNSLFASVDFTAQSSGLAKIEIDFVPGETNKSTIVEKGTSKNLLGKGDSISININ